MKPKNKMQMLEVWEGKRIVGNANGLNSMEKEMVLTFKGRKKRVEFNFQRIRKG